MTARAEASTTRREPLNRERVLRAAVDLADREGIEALSMRRLGQELGVEAMSLYNHVANKEDLLDGMVDAIVAEIERTDDRWWTGSRRRATGSSRPDAYAAPSVGVGGHRVANGGEPG